MKVTIEPGVISGVIAAPPSKSLSQRALAAALLHRGTTMIHDVGYSDDEQAALQIIQQLGATVAEQRIDNVRRKITVLSKGVTPITDEISCGESGLSARLFTPIAALHSSAIKISVEGSLLARPMEGMAEVLSALGVTVTSASGKLPFEICGPLLAGSFKMSASGGSQFLSGLLFALCDCATEPLTIGVVGLKSRPYIDLTLDVLAHFGRPIRHNRYREFYIDPALFTHSDIIEIAVEGDWSSASCMLVAGAIAGEIRVTNLNPESLQADRALLDILQQSGAVVAVGSNEVTVARAALQAFEFDATHCPDLFPALATLAVFCKGDSRIIGVHRLFGKESNRIESITEMLWSYGVHFSVEEDTLCIEGGTRPHGTIIDSYNDHRIVMAAAVCALRSKSRVDIPGAEAMRKSYPGFFTDFAACGARCELS
jgi:3-phosphoshikimate 1-carboxyvinyltransferase